MEGRRAAANFRMPTALLGSGRGVPVRPILAFGRRQTRSARTMASSSVNQMALRGRLASHRSPPRDIAQLAGPGAALIEFGSGSTTKARVLLRHMVSVRAYVDISPEFMNGEAAPRA